MEEMIVTTNNWHEAMSMPEGTYVRSTVAVLKSTMPKKIAAVEVYKETKQSKTLAIAILASTMLTAIAGSLHVIAGALTAAVFASFSIIFIRKTILKMKELEIKYQINPATQ
jgi:hypothetical protein